jgi:hypothetical protein
MPDQNESTLDTLKQNLIEYVRLTLGDQIEYASITAHKWQ